MIKAVGKRLLVQVIEDTSDKKGFLIVPSEKKNFTALVVAIGGEVDKNIDVGDVVHLLHDTGMPVSVNGFEYLSIVENQVIAVCGRAQVDRLQNEAH